MRSRKLLGRGMRRALLAAGLVLAGARSAPAQEGAAGAPPPKPAELVRISAPPVNLAAGGSGVAGITLEIRPGWHVNANPPSPDYMIPTEVSLAGAAGVMPGKTTYPAARSMKVGFDENPLAVYDGRVTLRVALAAARTAVNGSHALRGQVRFQSCNDEVCLPPAGLPFELRVTVSGGTEPGAPGAAAAAPDSGRGPPSTAPADTAAAMATPPAAPAGFDTGAAAPAAPASEMQRKLDQALARGALWWFLALFVGGLALNLTPCVFPMIGITVSVFGARRKEPPAKVLLYALAYVLGIAVTYSVLGVIAALTGGLFGAALQNPWVSVGLGVLFLVLALSMFGLYEMQPPPWMLERLGGAGTTSLVGIFVSGLAVGIVAAPCVGPFVVGVLVIIAQRGQALFGLQTMFALSLGLGFPYLFLALFSNLIQSLPRSGDWMLWVKKVFGVLLVAIGLFYVLLGLAPQLAQWVPPVALLAGGIYLGFLDRHGSAKRGFRVFKWVVGVLAVAWGIAGVLAVRAEGVRFQPYDEAAVRAALASGRPVLLDFSASWCVPCHELDRTTFTDRAVIDRSRAFAVFKVDLTRFDSPESKGLRQRFGVTGVPELLFFTPDGREVQEARVVGFIPPGPFLERMAFVASRAAGR